MKRDREVEGIERAIKRWRALRQIGVRIGEPFTSLVAAIAWGTTRSCAANWLALLVSHKLVSRRGDGTWRLEART